jgi:hypothetical protein
MVEARKARAVGFNHVALEVGDIEEALASTVDCSTSSFGAKAALRPSSTWATSGRHSYPTSHYTFQRVTARCRKGSTNVRFGSKADFISIGRVSA